MTVPPPPTGPGKVFRPETASPAPSRPRAPETEAPAPPEPPEAIPHAPRSGTFHPDGDALRKFEAELDVAELDDRDRPSSTWSARARSICRSSMAFQSRRMCYVDRMIVAAVHLIDDKPVTLFGRVRACEYESEGQYRVEMDLVPMPESKALTDWIEARLK
ncbi:MAG: hypothetical protein EA378_04400 [Phycisphaerales bacterium]|nr:MAG: hypothetical protein EA378_04400 [Phycisphaerales bacterium]